ncbi:MAG: hypothetical protein ACPHX2_06360, partial [Candidatus Poseidoniaceae archaeon]
MRQPTVVCVARVFSVHVLKEGSAKRHAGAAHAGHDANAAGVHVHVDRNVRARASEDVHVGPFCPSRNAGRPDVDALRRRGGGAREGCLTVERSRNDHAIGSTGGAADGLHVAAAVGARGPGEILTLAQPEDRCIGPTCADQHVFTGDEAFAKGQCKMHLSLAVGAQGSHLVDDLGGLNAEASHRASALIEFHDEDGLTVLACDWILKSVHVNRTLVVDGNEDRCALKRQIEDLHGLFRIQLPSPLPHAGLRDSSEEHEAVVSRRGLRQTQRGPEGGVARQAGG